MIIIGEGIGIDGQLNYGTFYAAPRPISFLFLF